MKTYLAMITALFLGTAVAAQPTPNSNTQSYGFNGQVSFPLMGPMQGQFDLLFDTIDFTDFRWSRSIFMAHVFSQNLGPFVVGAYAGSLGFETTFIGTTAKTSRAKGPGNMMSYGLEAAAELGGGIHAEAYAGRSQWEGAPFWTQNIGIGLSYDLGDRFTVGADFRQDKMVSRIRISNLATTETGLRVGYGLGGLLGGASNMSIEASVRQINDGYSQNQNVGLMLRIPLGGEPVFSTRRQIQGMVLN